ncbi:MAG: hypothetical protein WBG17_14870, partial [Burkholderiaceae bacterium]
PSMNPLFRPAAVAKVGNPDQLDRVLQVVRPLHVLAICVVALVVLSALMWSLAAIAPVKVRGHGILLAADGGLAGGAARAIVFVPNDDGRQVRTGMRAQVMPSTIRLQKDGFIHGTVVKAARSPSRREALMRRLDNAALVDELMRSGASFEIEVELEADPSSPSGYRWSSGTGPDVGIDAGTMARASVVVGEQRVIGLALPAFDRVSR